MRQLDLDPEVLEALGSYLLTELTNHNAERSKLVDRIIDEKKDFWAEPSEIESELPVIGFSSIIVPLTAIAVEAVHSRDMGNLYGLKELVSVDVTDSASDIKQGLEKLFNYELLNPMKFRAKTESPLLQITKHGTGIATVGYRETKRMAVKTKEGKEIRVPVYLERGTCIDGVPVEDFLMPFYCTEISEAPWVGHEFKISEYMVRQMVASGLLGPEAYNDLAGSYVGESSNRALNVQRELTDTEPVFPAEITLQRVLLDWDVDGDEKELVGIEVVYHMESKKILSAIYNEDRNYEKGIYFPLEYRWYGYGIGKMNREFQIEVTTQHRQRLDNSTIANMAMFKVKRSASYIKDDEPIFPGKKWYVEDMDDIQPMFIGDVKASAYNNENQVVIYSQQRTGVNELTLGMPQVGTPGTASDSMARIQESNRKSDYTNNNKREFLNKIIKRAASSIVRYGPAQREIYSNIPQGVEVETFLKSGDVLNNSFIMNVKLVNAKDNKILDRNTQTQLTGIATQYWTQLLALAQQSNDPAMVAAIVKSAMKSADGLMLEVLRSYDIPNPETHIFNIDAYKPAALPVGDPTSSEALAQNSGPAGGSNITSVLAPNARIEALGANPQFQFPQGSF